MKTAKRERTKYVWHIFNWAERFEMPDKSRHKYDGPLPYTREFVANYRNNDGDRYFDQLRRLRGKSNFLELKGAFTELRGIAANRKKAFRGFLLNQHDKAAMTKDIALWLQVELEHAKQILGELEDVGLIERIPLPCFNGQPSEEKPPSKSKAKSKSGKARPAKARQKAKKTDSEKPARIGAQSARTSAQLARKSAQFAEKYNGNDNVKRNLTARESTRRKPQTNPRHNPAHKGPKNIPKATARAETTGPAPTTTPPSLPRQSDARGSSSRGQTRASPSGSVTHKLPGRTEDLAHVMHRQYAKLDPRCREFAAEIYAALRIPHELTTAEAHRELGSFASAWINAQGSGLPPPMLADLRAATIREAGKIGKHRSRCKKPPAVWRKIFNKQLRSRSKKEQDNDYHRFNDAQK